VADVSTGALDAGYWRGVYDTDETNRIDLKITSRERLPKHAFLTPGGKILSPMTALKSIQVGTAEASDVAVAIDAEGHLPVGLLGKTFMRHFKVTVDQAQGQVKFERR
jgi:predicted aspartyl protease